MKVGAGLLYFSTVQPLLDSPIEYLKGVGPQRGELLRTELHIATFRDLLFHFPFRYKFWPERWTRERG